MKYFIAEDIIEIIKTARIREIGIRRDLWEPFLRRGWFPGTFHVEPESGGRNVGYISKDDLLDILRVSRYGADGGSDVKRLQADRLHKYTSKYSDSAFDALIEAIEQAEPTRVLPAGAKEGWR